MTNKRPKGLETERERELAIFDSSAESLSLSRHSDDPTKFDLMGGFGDTYRS